MYACNDTKTSSLCAFVCLKANEHPCVNSEHGTDRLTSGKVGHLVVWDGAGVNAQQLHLPGNWGHLSITWIMHSFIVRARV